MINFDVANRMIKYLVKKNKLDVYTVTNNNAGLKIQCDYSAVSCKRLCESFTGNQFCNENGFIEFNSKRINIVLT